jgi:fatty-acyl-CoA synthase
MDGLMMDVPLTLSAQLQRAEQVWASRRVVSRMADRSFVTHTYAQIAQRSKRLAVALAELGVRSGDRVATLAWNDHRHLEAYLAVPSMGAVLHTLNLRLHPDEIAYIVEHAQDSVILADPSLEPLLGVVRARVPSARIVMLGDEYEGLLASADPGLFDDRAVTDERAAAAMCYTSGTTGRPKGVLYSHRSMVLHSLVTAMGSCLNLSGADTVLPVVPMFHANAWGLPYACTMVGAEQVLPGPHLDPASLLGALAEHRVTITAGVPTIWLGILAELDANPRGWDLEALHTMIVGGSAAPESMIRGFHERHGLRVLHAWGMTEMSPLGTVSRPAPSDLPDGGGSDALYAAWAKQGQPAALVDLRLTGEGGARVPWDGESMGELEVRGPWVASSYYRGDQDDDRFTAGGWFRTGDIATIDHTGSVEIKDRAKDLVKSGGEWICSVTLENEIMAYPGVAEAAVVAVPDERWSERPLAVVVLAPGSDIGADELRAHLAGRFAKFWIPEHWRFVDEIPRTSVGKFDKRALRERLAAGASAGAGA